MAGVAVGIPLEIILMFRFGLPEVAYRNEGDDRTRSTLFSAQ
jgi:hypothetical protein